MRGVADVLRDRIGRGEYGPVGLSPSQRELREDFDISTTTAKAAIAQLEMEGLVHSQQGKGVFVRMARGLLRYTTRRQVRAGAARSGHRGGPSSVAWSR